MSLGLRRSLRFDEACLAALVTAAAGAFAATQLGFPGWGGQVSYGVRSCNAPQGRLFGCTGYDEFVWHWCDWQDGDWLNEQLDYPFCNDGGEISSITCL